MPLTFGGPILVCGLGHVGYRSVRLLRRLGLPVTAIDLRPRPEWAAELAQRGVRVMVGDVCNDLLLREAGLSDASALLAVTDQDGVNTEVVLDAYRMNPHVPLVLRVFDHHLAQQLASVLELRCAAGVSMLAAPSLAAAALGEDVVASFSLGGVTYTVGHLAADPSARSAEFSPLFTVTRDAPDLALAPHAAWRWHWKQRHDAARRERLSRPTPPRSAVPPPPRQAASRVRRTRWWQLTSLPLRAVAVALGLLLVVSGLLFRFTMHLSAVDVIYFLVTTLTTTGYGDITPASAGPAVKLYACVVMLLGSAMTAILYALLTEHLVAERFRALFTSHPVPARDHVIVVGLGNVGYRVVNELRAAGVAVVALAKEDGEEFVPAVRKHHATVIGDARLPEILLAAGIQTAAAIVAVTGEDTVNLSVALAAQRHHPDVRTVVRIFDEDFAAKVKHALRIDVVLSASAIAAPIFAASALFANVKASVPVTGGLLVLCAMEVPDDPDPAAPSHLAGYEAQTVLHEAAGGSVFVPYEPTTRLRAGDRLLLAVRVPWCAA